MSEKTLEPVKVSGAAHKALADNLRKWSGWPDATLVLADPEHPLTDTAKCDHIKRQFTVNIDRLLRNPNRVLRDVTPFRLRQEAVLTGVMLHEIGHARFTRWVPRTDEARAALRHGDGAEVTDATLAFARLLEEARVEGRVAQEAGRLGVEGLEWTLTASRTVLAPIEEVNNLKPTGDPNTDIMNLITAWVLRAGKARARGENRGWVRAFDDVLRDSLAAFFADRTYPAREASEVLFSLGRALSGDDEGPSMVDGARHILSILFPNSPNENAVKKAASVACQDGSEGEGSEGEGSEGEGSEGEGSEGEGSEGEGSEGEGNIFSEGDMRSLLSEAARADRDKETKAKDRHAKGASLSGGGHRLPPGFRPPTAEERRSQREAEQFLRDLLDPAESSKVQLTDQPSPTVDGAALAAWRASGGVRDPRFFRRTKRATQPVPPVRIGILVDVSSSMDVMQKPSSLLSWSLSMAAWDLRNFAGRGQQIQSALIHWGSSRPRVIQEPSKPMPGMFDAACNEGTSMLHVAMDTLADQLPGFYDVPSTPTNRLLVNFTDWGLTFGCGLEVRPRFHAALEAGVNILTVSPAGKAAAMWANHHVGGVPASAPGRHRIVGYSPNDSAGVWRAATEMLTQ